MDMNYRGGMWEGGGGQDGMELGGEWDNCNSIINKYIKKINYIEINCKKNVCLFSVFIEIDLFFSIY